MDYDYCSDILISVFSLPLVFAFLVNVGLGLVNVLSPSCKKREVNKT